MKTWFACIFALAAFSAMAATDCDCTTYPFKPNPPCYGRCVAKLSAKEDSELSAVKGIDPGVMLSIKILSSRPDRSDIDFSRIQSKKDLEGVALRSVENKTIKLEEGNSPKFSQ